MDCLYFCKRSRILGKNWYLVACRCFSIVAFALVLGVFLLPRASDNIDFNTAAPSAVISEIRLDKFLIVPQIVWGLNNQKIALARACLTARMLKRTLLMPSFSSSLFYKETNRLQPLPFDKLFNFEQFNSLCSGFVHIGNYSSVKNHSSVVQLEKGSGRKWTVERDIDQLTQYSKHPFHSCEVIKVVGKNPFLWHDHWPVRDYAKVFECLVLVDEISREVDKVVSKIKQIAGPTPFYVAVHMRIEIDWMIHCKNLEQRLQIDEICSSKEEIMQRVGNIKGLPTPTLLYLAVADSLLNDSSILKGWRDGLLPFEKKKLGVDDIYKKYPYLIQSAIDYEVCLRADVFVGNSFSTFSSLIVLERTQKIIKMGAATSCDRDVRWPSYAYNILGDSSGPRKWMTNMSEPSLQGISYGSNTISC